MTSRPRAHAAGAAHPDALGRGGGISNKSIRTIMRTRHQTVEGESSDEDAEAAAVNARLKARRALSPRSAIGEGMDEGSDDSSLFGSSSDGSEETDDGNEADDGFDMPKRPSIRNMSRNSFFNRAAMLNKRWSVMGTTRVSRAAEFEAPPPVAKASSVHQGKMTLEELKKTPGFQDAQRKKKLASKAGQSWLSKARRMSMLKKSDTLDAAIASHETKSKSRWKRAAKHAVKSKRAVKETGAGFTHHAHQTTLHPDVLALPGGDELRESMARGSFDLDSIAERMDANTDTEEENGGEENGPLGSPRVPRKTLGAPKGDDKRSTMFGSAAASTYLLHDMETTAEASAGTRDRDLSRELSRDALETGVLGSQKAVRRFSDPLGRTGSSDLSDFVSRDNSEGGGRRRRKSSERKRSRKGSKTRKQSKGKRSVGFAEAGSGSAESDLPTRPDGSRLIEISGKQFVVEANGAVRLYVEGEDDEATKATKGGDEPTKMKPLTDTAPKPPRPPGGAPGGAPPPPPPPRLSGGGPPPKGPPPKLKPLTEMLPQVSPKINI